MMNQTHCRLLIIFAVIGAIFVPGCKNPPPEVVARATDIEYDKSAPTSVAKAILQAMEREIEAIAAKDPAKAASYRALIEDQLASLKAVQLVNGNAVRTTDAAVKIYRNITVRWEAEIAYYASGIQYDQLRETKHETANETEMVAILVPAVKSDNRAVIRLDLAKTDADQWQVGSIVFVPPSAAKPTDQPATPANPAPTTQPEADATPEP